LWIELLAALAVGSHSGRATEARTSGKGEVEDGDAYSVMILHFTGDES
jgi:hypothetical protein